MGYLVRRREVVAEGCALGLAKWSEEGVGNCVVCEAEVVEALCIWKC